MAGSGKPARANVSPVARRIAIDLGVDLADLEGSGPGGRIVKADLSGAGAKAAESPRRPPDARPVAIPAAASAPASGADTASPSRLAESAKGELTTHQLTRLQQVIARRMAQSKATAPDFVLKTDVDMEAAVALRAQLREIVGAEAKLPSYNDFVVKACALALRETPLANGSYVDGSFELHGRVNVGIAVAATGALVVPTIFDADQKSLGEIARRSRELAAKVREGEITPPELSGGTFSVSNLGMFGVDEFTAVINPPQAAILAVGTLKQRAVVRDDQLVARQTMTISLTCDHRILYGADAADFLAHIRRLLEAPGGLVL
jgi:pyruvate dehydrogenase E2 component (dihydrolipoamide acetyltransferase)